MSVPFTKGQVIIIGTVVKMDNYLMGVMEVLLLTWLRIPLSKLVETKESFQVIRSLKI